MALQPASLIPSSVSFHKEGKFSCFKETSFVGISISVNFKSEFHPSSLRIKLPTMINDINGLGICEESNFQNTKQCMIANNHTNFSFEKHIDRIRNQWNTPSSAHSSHS